MGEMGYAKSWPPEDEERLKRLWATEHDLDLILRAFPDRTHCALVLRAGKLGVRRRSAVVLKERAAMPLTVAEAAWIAGFIDGEGTIAIYHRLGKHEHGFHPRVSVANTDMRAINRLVELIGAGYRTTRDRNPRHKIGHQWQTTNMAVIRALLAAIRPHLILKGEQADLVLEYIEARLSAGYFETPARAKDIYEQLKTLNRKGPLLPHTAQAESTVQPRN